ncbi:MAG TPA: hypothetical protein VGQ83_18015 [Polyangia bacterium]
MLSLFPGCSPTRTSVPDAGAKDAGPDGPLALDLLFVLSSTLDASIAIQDLSNYFPQLTHHLEALGEPLSLHVGIVGSDMGAGRFESNDCQVGGGRGALQNTPASDCPNPGPEGGVLLDPTDRYLRWSRTSAGDQANFAGPLANALLCYARGLDAGCTPSLLGSLAAALEGCEVEGGCRQPLNEGFLRREAALAVVLVANDDDCSVPRESAIFDPSPEARSTLGPYTLFRCLKFGVLCGGQPIGDEAGPRYDCEPGNPNPDPTLQLISGTDVARSLKGLKSDPRRVYVAAIAGPPTPVLIEATSNGPYPQPTCEAGGGFLPASPGIRLEAFVREFGSPNGRFLPFCREGEYAQFAWQLDQVGADLVGLLAGAPKLSPAASEK